MRRPALELHSSVGISLVPQIVVATDCLPRPPRPARTVQAGELRIFGLPADLSSDGRIVGGPAGQSPDRWLWAAYAAPTPALRTAALSLVDEDVFAAWSVGSPIRGQRNGAYLGVRTRRGYFLIAIDEQGGFLAGYCDIPGLSMTEQGGAYRELARASEWLRSGGPIATGALNIRPSRHSRAAGA